MTVYVHSFVAVRRQYAVAGTICTLSRPIATLPAA